MKKFMMATILVFALLLAVQYIAINPNQSSAFVRPLADTPYDIEMKRDLLCIMLAYPEYVESIEKTGSGKVYIVLKSGLKLIYDDGKQKNMEGKMLNPDIQDMLEQPYPLETTRKLMDKDFDPGRVRVYGLLKEVYGGSKQQVENKLANVRAGGRSFQFNKSNGAGAALKSAMEDLIPLTQSNKRAAAASFPTSGTYNYRVISGTNRLSPHAFGIAIDLARDKRDYWQWATREEGQKRLDSYPVEVVEIFERHNFVWGGKWGHFDTLHFEYRPEIIMKARFFGKEHQIGEPWYKGATEEDRVREAIDKIEAAL